MSDLLTEARLEAAKRFEAKQKKRLTASARKACQRMARLARYEIEAAFVSLEWDDPTTLSNVILVRKTGKDRFALVDVLIDLLCFGTKDAIARTDLSEAQVVEHASAYAGMPNEVVIAPATFAARLVQDAFLMRLSLEFDIPRDVFAALAFFKGIEPMEEVDIPLGKDGMPVLMPGPFDDVSESIAHLDRVLGEENYLFIDPTE